MNLESRKRSPTCLSQYAIDCLVADELDAAAIRQANDHLAACPDCRTSLARTRAEKEEFTARAHSYPQRQPQAEPPAPPWRQLLPWLLGGAPALAGALVLLLLLGPWIHPDEPREQREQIQRKGSTHLSFVVEHRGKQRQGRPEESVFPGDKIQLFYTTSAKIHLAVFNLDERRQLTVLFPQVDQTAAIRPGEHVGLPFSVELDETLGAETFYGVFCSRPQRIAALKRGLAGPIPRIRATAGCYLDTITLHKRALPHER